ncbi:MULTISPECIES: TraR/DksA family transcriptional regulator [Shimia]|uniref:TraR/DksA family transcriptional regulator n=1 Tax=Shimia TaxID=573139 RepID=UPI001FB38D54|nr:MULTISPECIES: TraR/DksA family transcriptional regulator [Shimia]MDV4145576.1 TraR/DksA family transcriptional regulator [Shimia sp. FJ5]
MNESESAKFRAMIETRLAQIEEENRLGAEGQSVVTLDQQAVGRLSRMDALQSQAMAKAGQARRDGEVRKLRAALDRIKEGEFGYCEDCGGEIALKRLAFDPGAALCISCASG